MFKIGELVSSRAGPVELGVVIEIKRHFGIQYCRVLWTGEGGANWVSSEQLSDRA